MVPLAIIGIFFIVGWAIVLARHFSYVKKCSSCKRELHTECGHAFFDIICNPMGKKDVPVFHCGPRITHCRLFCLTAGEREEIKEKIEELD